MLVQKLNAHERSKGRVCTLYRAFRFHAFLGGLFYLMITANKKSYVILPKRVITFEIIQKS